MQFLIITISAFCLSLSLWASAESAQDNKMPPSQTSIRSAIKLALLQHEGTVLSADDEAEHYAIKILSKSGTVKVIHIRKDQALIPVLTPSVSGADK